MSNILIVDDSQVIQRVLSMQLRKSGYGVFVASSAYEALECLAATPIDLAIMDIAMPEVDGLTLLRQVRADPNYHAMPVIMLTASGQDQDRIAAREANASAFLSKPTSSRELLETVQRLLPSNGT